VPRTFNVTHRRGSARDAASVHFRPSVIRRRTYLFIIILCPHVFKVTSWKQDTVVVSSKQQQVCLSLLSGRNVRWPRRMLHPWSVAVSMPARETDRCQIITLRFSLDAANVKNERYVTFRWLGGYVGRYTDRWFL